MGLSSELISQFVKVTNDNTETKKESTIYGTVVEYDGAKYVKLDGSDLLTPMSSTTVVNNNDRVMIQIQNHTATVTGNLTTPSASSKDVDNLGSKIDEFDTIISYKVSTQDLEAFNATIENLNAVAARIENADIVIAEIETLKVKMAEMEYVSATDAEILNADIERLEAEFAKITDISAENAEIINAEITNLKGYTANFTYVSTEVLTAIKADIKTLNTEKLSAKDADLKYANIDFSNIGEAAVTKIFSESGIIKDLIVSEGKITGELVGVTIKGDLIEGNTVKADKLVVKGSDGLYYKLNFESGNFADGEVVPDDGLHGSVIVANSITAEKIQVDDLVAFDATIGGFNITKNSIYSGVKESVNNTTKGVYLDNDGQVAFGDSNNYIKYYKDTDNKYKLIISAANIIMGSSGTSIYESIKELQNTTNLAFRIESSSGIAFTTNQNGTTILTARLYKGDEELDANGDLNYKWYAVNADGSEQILGVGKTIEVSIESVAGKGVYFTADDGNEDDMTTTAIVGLGVVGRMIVGKGG